MTMPWNQYNFNRFTVFDFECLTVTATNNCFGCDSICDGEPYSCDMSTPEPDAVPTPHQKATRKQLTRKQLKSMSEKELLQHIAATLDKIAEQQAYTNQLLQNGIPTREMW